MGYLHQFARNRRSKEKTTVLTARLPESLYNEFQSYCDELGLSISEAVNLLVDREISGNNGRNESVAPSKKAEVKTKKDEKNTSEDGLNTTVFKVNTDDDIDESNRIKTTAKKTQATSNRFTTNQWKIDGTLPCPICNEWRDARNFSRHVKSHDYKSTEALLTNEGHQEKLQRMIAEKQRGKHE